MVFHLRTDPVRFLFATRPIGLPPGTPAPLPGASGNAAGIRGRGNPAPLRNRRRKRGPPRCGGFEAPGGS